MTPRTLTKSDTAKKRRGRPAKAQASGKTLVEILVDPAEQLAEAAAGAAAGTAAAAKAQKDAAVYAEMKRIKAADEVREAERLKRETAIMAPLVRAAVAIGKLPRECGGVGATGNRVLITVPGGGLIELAYSDDDKDRPVRVASDHRDYHIGEPLTVDVALTWLMRTALDFGVKLPE